MNRVTCVLSETYTYLEIMYTNAEKKNKHLSKHHMSTAHIRIINLLRKLLENVHNKHRRIKKYVQYFSWKTSRKT